MAMGSQIFEMEYSAPATCVLVVPSKASENSEGSVLREEVLVVFFVLLWYYLSS